MSSASFAIPVIFKLRSGMNAILHFFRGWLGLYFLLVHFVIPFYLVAIYPDVPEPAVRFLRGAGYGLISGAASELGFWYRFIGCGAWVVLGLLILSRRLRDIAGEAVAHQEKKINKRKRLAE